MERHAADPNVVALVLRERDEQVPLGCRSRELIQGDPIMFDLPIAPNKR